MMTSQIFFGLTQTGVEETIEEYNTANIHNNTNWRVASLVLEARFRTTNLGRVEDNYYYTLVLERD